MKKAKVKAFPRNEIVDEMTEGKPLVRKAEQLLINDRNNASQSTRHHKLADEIEEKSREVRVYSNAENEPERSGRWISTSFKIGTLEEGGELCREDRSCGEGRREQRDRSVAGGERTGGRRRAGR
ncbi:hypothetical protein L6452_39171 [Arctium lappa]|uniref:Uncharacterized protein n=1 Tax=Arctium lappa TaxID=4217 RepID=A0ACB8XS71_ARCLA|nr:hypothetical protein L6452_39171 [Arctium lappa]